MRPTGVVLLLMFAFLGANVAASERPGPRPLAPDVWVDDGTRNCDGNFPCLQSIVQAINTVDLFGTIHVYGSPLPYVESPSVNRPVTIVGENRANVTVSGRFDLTVPQITLRTLAIRNGGVGVNVQSSGNTLEDLNITGVSMGLRFFPSSFGNVVRNVEVTNADGVAVLADGADGLVLDGLVLTGGGRGIAIIASADVLIQNTSVSGAGDVGIELEGCGGPSILNSYVTGGRDRGVRVNASNGVTVRGNRIENNNLTGLNITGSVNVVVEGNTITGNGAAGIAPGPGPSPWQATGGGLWFWQTDPVTVANNTITGNHLLGVGIGGGASTDYVLVNNTISGNVGTGLVLTGGPARLDVTGVFQGNQGDGIAMDNVTSVAVHNATVQGNTGMGISGQQAVNVTIVGNRVQANGGPVPRRSGPVPRQGGSGGLWFWQTDPSEIRENQILGNWGAAVTLIETTDFNITGNTMDSTLGQSVVLVRPRRTFLSDNQILNSFVGVDMNGGDATSYRNRYSANPTGVSLLGGASWVAWNDTFNATGVEYRMNQASRAVVLNQTFSARRFGISDDLSNITVQWFLRVSVLDPDGNPAPGATVRVLDASGAQVFAGTTDAQGRASWIVLAEEDVTKPQTYRHTPHEVHASLTGPDEVSTTVNLNRSQAITLQLFRDSADPTISFVRAIPDPQEQFLAVNVSADVLDQTALTVSLNVTFPDATWANATMARGAGDSFYLSRSYGQVGVHAFTITATDAWGNVAVAGGSFSIWTPNAPPAISNVGAAPDPQESGSRVNVTAQVLDADGLSSVTVEITYPDASRVTRPMLPAAGGVWYYEAPYSALGTYGFTITATDGNGTFPRSAQANGSFVVQDTTDPTANAGPDQTVLQGDTVTFDGSGSSDNHGIQAYVWTFTDVIPVTLTDVAPTYTFLRIGVFLVTLTVFDLSGLTGTDTMTVTVRDVTPPVVVAFGANPSPAESPGTTNASFAVVEANVVAVAKVAAYDPSDQLIGNVTAGYDPGSGRFYQVWALAALGTYRFVAYVEDGSGNFAVASTTVFARDTTPPAAVAPVAAPNPVQVLSATTLSAQVSDAHLTSVSVQIRDPAATPVANLTMVFNASTGRYEASYTPTIPGAFTFVVWALDTSGNAGSVAGGFTSADAVPPVLSGLTVAPQPANVGATVDVSVIATDDFGIDRVWIDLADPFGTPVGTFDLVYTAADGRWHDTRAYSQSGTYTFTVFASDGVNIVSVPGQVLVRDTIPPAVGPLSKTPVTWETGGTILVQATVADNVGIQGPVRLRVIDPLGVEVGNHTMTCGPGNVCAFSRAYGIAGTYTLRIWAFDAAGNVGTNGDALVIVTGQPPIADAGPDLVLDAGRSAAFDGSGSTDDYGIVSYNWTFTHRGGAVSLAGARAAFTFEDPGTYTVTLTVTDSGGRTAMDTVVVTVQSAGLSPFLLGGIAIVIILGIALGGWIVLRRAKRRDKESDREPPEKETPPVEKPRPETPKPVDEGPTDDDVERMLEELDELENL